MRDWHLPALDVRNWEGIRNVEVGSGVAEHRTGVEFGSLSPLCKKHFPMDQAVF